MQTDYDICIIGGGINGVGIAAQAAQAGLSVLLCEQNDLASGTSSASSKLIHGGLRYLEHFEFNLVRKALSERELLMHKAPHLVNPLNFVLPYKRGLRPAWMLRLGLWLYDHLGRQNSLPKSHKLKLHDEPVLGGPLRYEYTVGFSYSDCWVDDARLVIANAQQASQLDAKILTQHAMLSAKAQQGAWQIVLHDKSAGKEKHVSARALINATGPWANRIDIAGSEALPLKLVKGSHIIVRKRYPGKHAYILQSLDDRVIFIVPLGDDFHIIGTTEEDYDDNLHNIQISQPEIHYLCHNVNRYLLNPIRNEDIVHSFSGVRPLLAENNTSLSALSRDYQLKMQMQPAPLLTVLGGKITTYRILAEHALRELQPLFSHCKPVAAYTRLPGGDIANNDFTAFYQQLQHDHPWLEVNLALRYAHSYGSQCHELLTNVHSEQDLGQHFGHGLYAREVDYLCTNEWARNSDDILWRRTKLGLYFDAEQSAALSKAIKQKFLFS